jgi:RHS repeat-associated protein
LGRETVFEYDALGRQIVVTLPDLDGAGGEDPPEVSYTYDLVGNLLTETDAEGNVTTYAYDNIYRLITVTEADPDGGGAQTSPVTTYEYDAAGQLLSVTDPLGRETAYQYDALGRRIKVTLPDPDGQGGDPSPEIEYDYDLAGNVVGTTDALGNVTAYAFDNLFRLISVTEADPDGTGGGQSSPVTTYEYDAAGQLLSVTDPLGRETSYQYDPLGRRIKLIQPDPDGVGGEDPPETDYEFDFAGHLVSVTDPLGNVTTYAYDNLYRRVSTTQPDPDAGGALSAPVTSFSYDAAGNMTSLTDPVGNVTSWVYDAHNRTIEETNELEDTRYFEYDAAGNLVEKTDRNGLVTEFAYDDLYRLATETWLDGETTVNTLSFEYDAAGQMTDASDDVSSYTYTYNGLGQVTLIEIDNGGPLVELVQEFTPVGSRSLLAASFDDGGGMDDDFQNIFYYDNIQRLVQIDQSGVQGGNTVAEKRVNFAYNAAGQFTSIDRYKDLDGASGDLVATTAFVYDGIGRLTDLTHTHDTTTIADYDWTFDAFSRVTSMSFTALVGDDGSSAYTYDDTNQLTGADHDFQTDETYEYDENGNRTMSGYATGDNNLTTSDGTYDYEYDDEGNRTKKTHISLGDYVTYEWDHRNRLVGVEFRTSGDVLTKRVEYEYDLFNRRISKRVDDDGDTNSDWAQRFVYDGDSIVLVFDDTGSLTNRYLHGPAVDQILADEDSLGEVLWPLADNLGTVRDLVDSDGDVVNHLTYNAFGAITSQTAPSLEPLFTYTGREWDPDVELYFYRARWYDPVLAQFISQDPIAFAAQDPNLRRYVSNAPTIHVDPFGLAKNRWFPRSSDEWGEATETLAGLLDQVEDHIFAKFQAGASHGSYGNQVSSQLNSKLRSHPAFRTGVIVDLDSGEIVGFDGHHGYRTSSGAVTAEFDIVYFEGDVPKVGDKLDVQKSFAFEAKTSCDGYMRTKQLNKYRAVFGDRWAKVTSKYRQVGSALVENASRVKRMRTWAMVGLPAVVAAASAYQAFTFDAEGPMWEDLQTKIVHFKNSDTTAESRFLAGSALVDSYFAYIKAATGGQFDDELTALKRSIEHDRIIPLAANLDRVSQGQAPLQTYNKSGFAEWVDLMKWKIFGVPRKCEAF